MAAIQSVDVARSVCSASKPRPHTMAAPSDAAIRLIRRDGAEWHTIGGVCTADLVRSPKCAFDALERQIVAENSTFQTRASELIVSAPARTGIGFDVDVSVERNNVHASFGGLMHEFSAIGPAMMWLRRALSETYHLRTTFIGNSACQWSLEPVCGGATCEDSLVSRHWQPLLGFCFKRVTYRQNHTM